jgi:hypothetical protein
MQIHRKPLDPLRAGAYRPQRWDAVCDLLDDGYVQRLPPKERQWMERYMREQYGANATALRTGLHADRLKPEAMESLPRRVRRWWGRQTELWPALAVDAAMRALGLNPGRAEDREAALDASLRRAVYAEQNAATRDVYSLRRVVYLEEIGGRE